MGRKPCCDKVGLKRGPWSIEEDQKLTNFILNNGIHCWRHVPMLAGLLRCGKSCRLRWLNYLRPDLKRGDFTDMEESRIIELHACLGNKWSQISAHFPGRTDNEIKNHWNTRIKKKLKLLGIDPLTHKPIEKVGGGGGGNDHEHVTASKSSPMKTLQEGLEVMSSSDGKPNEAFSSLEDNIEQSTTMERLQEILEPMSIDCPNERDFTGRKEERLSKISSSLDHTIDLINSYEFRYGGFHFGLSTHMSQENNTSSTCSCSSVEEQ